MRILAAALPVLLIATEARADEVADFVGAASSGLPGVNRVAIAGPRAPLALTAAANAGYAFTEAQKGESGSHHRGFGSLGVAVQPLRFLAVSLELDGRVDAHPKDALGSHTSALGEPRLAVRVAEALGKAVALGAQIDWRLPGAEFPSIEPGSSSIDGRLLATFAPAKDFAVALNAGYRLDRTANLVDDPARVRQGDRLSLGASAFDAVLLGVGAAKRFGPIELNGEVTWEPLLGTRAPSAIESPLRIGLGGRYALSDALQAELKGEVVLSERPGSLPIDPLAPIDPRFMISVGFRFTRAPKKADVAPVPDAHPAVTPPPRDTTPALATIQGKVVGDGGEPIADATVTVGDKSVQTATDGTYTLTDVPVGKATVYVKAPGFEERTSEVEVGQPGGAAPRVDFATKHLIKPGQLRGLIRAFSGKAVVGATIRVEPLGTETKTDADGVFTIDVPPGSYEVVVTATGFASQRRKMQVEENGVTILNADLRQGP